ncbi:MAG TPA: sugar transferase [Gammaproteobacteria bacterium]|nr:sugar transferase [Gammaproteobacteria bacterium]
MSIGKRLFDVCISVIGGLLLLPFLFLITLLIYFDNGWPVFFSQERAGYRGQLFRICKFRTMVRNAERLGQSLTVGQDPRITRVGRWLRKCKLDELPQLINVLKGEMSLVGPRPEVPHYVALYSPEQRRVLQLVPGITDPASIAFRDEASMLADCEDPERAYIERIMPNKIRVNLEYASRATLWSDILILLKTVMTIINSRADKT